MLLFSLAAKQMEERSTVRFPAEMAQAKGRPICQCHFLLVFHSYQLVILVVIPLALINCMQTLADCFAECGEGQIWIHSQYCALVQ